MFVKFIAHAGLAIEEDGVTILVDPWFTDSTVDHPILEGLLGRKTIDYQIPPTKEKPSDYTPRAILLSHFHTHHAPKRDILNLIENTFHDVILGYPVIPENESVVLKEVFSKYKHVRLNPKANGEQIILGPFTITAYAHTVRYHVAWHIKSRSGSILHISDAPANKNNSLHALDQAWDQFTPLKPDLLFLSAGRNSARYEIDGKRVIVEAACMSPIQGARLVQRLEPKVICSMGNHNHSLWKNRPEFIPEKTTVEEELHWALEWLAPDTKLVIVRPGHTFSLGQASVLGKLIDTYI